MSGGILDQARNRLPQRWQQHTLPSLYGRDNYSQLPGVQAHAQFATQAGHVLPTDYEGEQVELTEATAQSLCTLQGGTWDPISGTCIMPAASGVDVEGLINRSDRDGGSGIVPNPGAQLAPESFLTVDEFNDRTRKIQEAIGNPNYNPRTDTFTEEERERLRSDPGAAAAAEEIYLHTKVTQPSGGSGSLITGSPSGVTTADHLWTTGANIPGIIGPVVEYFDPVQANPNRKDSSSNTRTAGERSIDREVQEYQKSGRTFDPSDPSTWSDDAQQPVGGGSSGGGGSSDSGSSKVVCTAMNEDYGFGTYRQAIWLKYSKDHLTKAHEVGYHAMFLPLLSIRKKWYGKPIYALLKHIARHRTADLRAEMQGKKRDRIGQAWRFILEPLVYTIGKIKGAK